MYTDMESDCIDGDILTSTTGIRDWITGLLKTYVLTSTLTSDYTTTGKDATYAQETEITSLRDEITGLQGEITGIQEQLVALGIVTLVNGILTAVTDTIQAGAVATALGKCMKLSGSQTLTGSITLSSGNNYTFCGALPYEIGYLIGVTSSIQTQLNKCITSIPTNFTTLTLNGNTVATTNQPVSYTHLTLPTNREV